MNLTPQNVWPHAVAIATAVVGQVVAYVPAWRPEAQAIISAGAVVIAFGILVYEAIIRHGTVAAGASQVVKVARSDIETVVKAEPARVFAAPTPTQTPPPAVSAPPAPPAPPTPPAA